MDQNDLNRIADALVQRLGGNKPIGGGSGVQRPRELDDPNTDPTLRAKVLEGYTGALMDRPQATWSEAERRSVLEQTQTVLRGMGY